LVPQKRPNKLVVLDSNEKKNTVKDWHNYAQIAEDAQRQGIKIKI
jgi:chitinase